MFNIAELPDHIYKELSSVSKLYHDEKNINRVNTLDIHINDSETVVSNIVTSFISKVKGIIRRDECAYLEVEGIYTLQTCYVSNVMHNHAKIIVTTKYDDPYMFI